MSTLNGQTAEITWGSSENITDITQASSAVISVASTSGFASGDRVIIQSVTGMTEINGLHGTISSVVTDTSITVNINSTGFSSYTSGGTITKVIDITKFTITKKGKVSDVTDSSSTYEEFVATGYVEVSGSFEGYLKSGVSKPTFHSEIAFVFYEDSSNYLSGSGIITDEGTSVDIVGTNAVQVTYTFQGTGTYSDTN